MEKVEFQAWLQEPMTREVSRLLQEKSSQARNERQSLDPRGWDRDEFFEKSLTMMVREIVWADVASFLTDDNIFEEEFDAE
jgi:hypothetical protein